MKIVVVGDLIVSCELLQEAAKQLKPKEDITIKTVYWPAKDRKDFQKKALHLETEGPEAEEVPVELYEEIVDAEILLVHFCPVSAGLIEKSKKLKLIGTCRGGMEHVDITAATKAGIPVIHVIRNAEAASDFTLGLMFAETRNIARAHAALKDGIWRKEYENSQYTTTFKQMTLGIVGLGHIGKLVAEKALGIGMQVIAFDPYISQDIADEKGLRIKMTDKETLFKTADVVTLHLRLTPETENSINKSVLDLMKPTAYLINTSRARVIHKNDLLQVLQEKRIGGAALDVFWEEPIPKDDLLLQLDNLTITPHNAGNVVDALPRSPMLLVDTIRQFWKTGKSDMVVNLKQLKQ